MALNTFKCTYLTPLHFGLMQRWYAWFRHKLWPASSVLQKFQSSSLHGSS